MRHREMVTKKSSSIWLKWLGGGLILIAIILLIYFFLSGQTTISGNYPKPIKNTTLSCEILDISYPYFMFDMSDSKRIEVNIVFGDNHLETISLTAILYYDDESDMRQSNNINQISVSKSMNESGIREDMLSTKFSASENSIRMNIYARSKDLTTASRKFFLISGDLSNTEDYISNYTHQGFTCEMK